MDPNQALYEMLRDLTDDGVDFDGTRNVLESLIEWREKGGFAPDVASVCNRFAEGR